MIFNFHSYTGVICTLFTTNNDLKENVWREFNEK